MNTNQPLQVNIETMLAYYHDGQYVMAQNLALSITKEFPNHNISWKILAEIYAHDGKMDMALTSIQSAIRINSKDAEAHNNMSSILFKLNLAVWSLFCCQFYSSPITTFCGKKI